MVVVLPGDAQSHITSHNEQKHFRVRVKPGISIFTVQEMVPGRNRRIWDRYFFYYRWCVLQLLRGENISHAMVPVPCWSRYTGIVQVPGEGGWSWRPCIPMMGQAMLPLKTW